MAHPEQMDFVQGVRGRFPDFFRGTNVLEVGSRNVNGSVRQFFSGGTYVGLDCEPGPGVDVVSLAHEYKPPTDALFDVVISCEAFEHDPYLRKSLTNVMRYLRIGGLFVATCASSSRPEHGTRKTLTTDGIFGPDPDYYRGVSSADLRAILALFLDPMTVISARAGLDVYAFGLRADTAKLLRREGAKRGVRAG